MKKGDIYYLLNKKQNEIADIGITMIDHGYISMEDMFKIARIIEILEEIKRHYKPVKKK